MTFIQILVLVIVVCVSAVQCVSIVAKASVMKRKIGVPDDSEIASNIVGAMINADNSGASVRVDFRANGTTILYFPKGNSDESVQDRD